MPITRNRLYVGFEYEFLFKGSLQKLKKLMVKEMAAWNIPFRGKNSFVLKGDSSIEEFGDWVGYEIATPVMAFGVGKKFTKAFFNFMKKNCLTTDTCGLHANLSFVKPDLNVMIDPSRLTTAIDEENLLLKWDRVDYHYAVPKQGKIKSVINRNKKRDSRSIKSKISEMLIHSADHYDAISFEKLEDCSEWSGEDEPYVEFRIMGGRGYHRKIQKVFSTLTEFEKAMNWSVNEYYDRYVTKKINTVRMRMKTKPLPDCSGVFLPH